MSETIAPDGSRIRLLVTDAQRASLVEVTLPAGAVSRPVRHRTVEEIWFFLEGDGRVWVGGAVTEVGPGSRVVIPTGQPFQFAAAATGALRFLCYTSPPWPGEDEAVALAEGGLGAPTV
ncbi:MAG TPA: cupin domain-containing protein [Candidatus Dormibacteraeota bacterium]